MSLRSVILPIPALASGCGCSVYFADAAITRCRRDVFLRPARSDSLAQELGNQGAGVIVSQVVPFPGDRSLPVVMSYQTALSAVNSKAKPGFVSLEGYLVGQLVVETLKRIPGEPTREAFLDAIERAPFDLGGVKLSFSASQNQGSNQVYFTVLQSDGTFRPVTRLVKSAAR